MPQAHDQPAGLVGGKDLGVPVCDSMELGKVSRPHRLGQLEVGGQRLQDTPQNEARVTRPPEPAAAAAAAAAACHPVRGRALVSHCGYPPG